MKPSSRTRFSLLLAAALLGLGLTTSTHAAIWWEATTPASYTAGTPVTFVVDPTQERTGAGATQALAYQEIEVTATSSVDGTRFYTPGGAGGQIQFVNSSAIVPGASITFTFDFNMQLFSGPRAFGALGSFIRSAALFRAIPPSGTVDATVAATMTGGADTLQTYFGTTPTVGALSHVNPGIFQFNGGAFSLTDNRAAFSSLSGDTVVFTEGTDTTQFGVALVDPGRNSVDFSFDHWTFTYTNDSATDLAAGTVFLFTFEGHNPEAQAALIPEPGRALLLFCAALALFANRRRHRG